MKATTKTSQHLVASSEPRAVIESLARRADQPASMRQYREGFEEYFNMLPVLRSFDPLLDLKAELAGDVMKALASAVEKDASLLKAPADGQFKRVILGVETPSEGHEGSEVLVAQWGKGFTSPVHGHAPGLLHEEILMGKMLVHTYLHVGQDLVRPVRTEVVGPGTLVSKYSPPSRLGKRVGLVHNFVALTPAVSLHFVPEHTRDGRDNRFRVEHFKDFDQAAVQQLTINEGIYLQVGDVALVRSDNVPEYGDHFIVVTGGPVLKPHGLRPAEVAIQAGPEASALLDYFAPVGNTGLRLLKLDEQTGKRFLDFHGIKFAGTQPFFPKA